jgi:hypothetical protein
MRYIYRSRVGVFYIMPDGEGRWWLGVDGERLGSFHSPQAAADDMSGQHTGYHPWDSLPKISEPTDLSEWEKLP